uniref:Ankyrin n=1 Tax=Trichogramma kaykai TaxID=54128 RepID=A0ABD2XA94_9HYME
MGEQIRPNGISQTTLSIDKAPLEFEWPIAKSSRNLSKERDRAPYHGLPGSFVQRLLPRRRKIDHRIRSSLRLQGRARGPRRGRQADVASRHAAASRTQAQGVVRDPLPVESVEVDQYDVNYTDESGLTHFRIACEAGCAEAIEKFLEHDPRLDLNGPIGDPPLHRALSNRLTPLQVACRDCPDRDYLLETLCWKDKCLAVRLDTRDRLGNTPLRFALASPAYTVIEHLLRWGADPDLANARGETPLNVVCSRVHRDDRTVDTFFSINEEKKLTLRVDARDELGNAPLHLAVAAGAGKKRTIECLLRRGEILNFIFLA